MKYRVLIDIDEDGVFIARCPELPGCVSHGDTREDAIASVREAAEGYVLSLRAHGEPVPQPLDETFIEVSLAA